ncbi:hypothetical protein NNC19_16655 [Clostridium sp. SHJSY1]|uniref:hypothetical protein n=1 Tax=Clostridium sp. SHJSY1 TaxID=2942483 RepID=UPI002874D06A|nr:hypothetical protein [Clostridium sp. SHJSY1]MDS0527323.1 hypothetical protein [Clostridium sp. SHJSY1]
MNIRGVFKERGYVLVNVLLILMVISLISCLAIKVVINNKLYNSLEHKKDDIYSLGDIERALCSLNKYSKDNREFINEIRSKGIEKDLIDGMKLSYVKEIDKFHYIYIDKGLRYETYLRYKSKEEGIIFLPLQEKLCK